MRFWVRGRAQHTCPSCLLQVGKSIVNHKPIFPHIRQGQKLKIQARLHSTRVALRYSDPSHRRLFSCIPPLDGQNSRGRNTRSRHAWERQRDADHGIHKRYSTATVSENAIVELSEEQMQQLHAAQRLRRRLQIGFSKVPKTDSAQDDGPKLESVLGIIENKDSSPEESRWIDTLTRVYAGQAYSAVESDLARIINHRNVSQRKVQDTRTKEILQRVGLLQSVSVQQDQTSTQPQSVSTDKVSAPSASSSGPSQRTKGSLVKAMGLATPTKSDTKKAAAGKQKAQGSTSSIPSFPTRKPNFQMVAGNDLELKAVDLGQQPLVPELSFDLSRVLFNPGIYHLRDPRSRVYNFDPYLEEPMPLSEFNFDALNEYVTSSEDSKLIDLARRLGKRYVGSSSSMSGALCQFHFLLSQWRELNISELSRGFGENNKGFTAINKTPAAIFLRYRDGVYAVDADKEYDEPNVLMSLGKSLEKLLTLEKGEIEKWRKTHTAADQDFSDHQDEAFHYSQQGGFLLRSQLDARDSRLPGSGVFDLKTRAVAGIRMNMRGFEEGKGYQIRERFGTWESFEREYYDMMRSTFLKYSMQVRMGNMDGIFVAYHNIEHLFGFQYIPLTDIDYTIHGQRDTCLGDQEFRFSINFMNQIFDMATKEYPEQSLRLHFDTREPTNSDPTTSMYIFAEPMTNEEIDKIQKQRHDEFVAYEKKLFNGEDPNKVSSELEVEMQVSEAAIDDMFSTLSDTLTKSTTNTDSETAQNSSLSSTSANTDFLEKLIQALPQGKGSTGPRPVMGLKLKVENVVNNDLTLRPEQIQASDNWAVRYSVERLGDDNARKLFVFTKNRRMRALSSTQSTTGSFFQKLQNLSARGAAWRQEQKEIDSQQEKVILYEDRIRA